ncbi:MAG TPA: protein kinase [Drouetiella sp.]
MDSYNDPNKSHFQNQSGPNSRSLIGAVIAGKYKILAELGEGGMSSVYEAQDLVINRIVALKLLSTIRSTDERSVIRFKKEAMAAGRLNHPNIVQLFDVGIHEDGTPYMVMDCVRGETLSARISRLGHLSIVDAIGIITQVCDALSHAHEKGVIHRDIKPSNLMITENFAGDEQVKILDFGIAKVWDEATSVQQSTRTGEVFGSPLYMSPEQAVSGSKVDARSDIYSTACALFEALAGSPPFVGETTLHTIMKHQTDIAPTLREASLGEKFPDVLEKVVAKALSKKQDDRYQTMDEFGAALRDVVRRIKVGEQLNVARSTPNPGSSSTSGSNKLVSKTAIVALLVVLLAGTAYVVYSYIQASNQNQSTQSSISNQQRDKEKESKNSDSQSTAETAITPESTSAATSATAPQSTSAATPATAPQSTSAAKSATAPQSTSAATSAPTAAKPPLSTTEVESLFPKNAYDPNLRDQSISTGMEQDLEEDFKANPDRSEMRYRGAKLTRKFLGIVGKFKDLTELNLTESKFDDTSPQFAALAKLPLKKLAANGSTLGNAGMLAMTKSPTLVKIEIVHCPTISDAGLKNINQSSALQSLAGGEDGFTDAGIKLLSRSDELKALYLSDNQKIEGKTLGSLARSANLERLHLAGTSVSDATIAGLAGCSHLVELDLSRNRLTSSCAPTLAKLTALRTLLLSDTAFDDNGLLQLTKLTNLKFLFLESCPRISMTAKAKFHAMMPQCRLYDEDHAPPPKHEKEKVF